MAAQESRIASMSDGLDTVVAKHDVLLTSVDAGNAALTDLQVRYHV
jgi:hypothetical protein